MQMQMMTRTTVLVLVTLLVLAGVVLLDRAGVFIYFGYVPALAIFVTTGVGMLIGLRQKPVAKLNSLVLLVAFSLFTVCAFALPRIETGPRKGFYLAAAKVKPGMSKADVHRRMSTFDSSPFSKEAGVETYRYSSSKHTVDTFTVRLDGNDRVRSTSYSAD